MQFRILGPLEAADDDGPLDLGTPRQRTLLGLLLIRVGTVVSTDRLIGDLWGGDPPETARHTLQVYVHRLRRTLGDEAWRLQTRAPGYLLKVSSDELDAQRFEELSGEGHRALVRGDHEQAASLLNAALGLWRGPVLADLEDVAAFEPERARLEGLRLTAFEDRVEAALTEDQPASLVEEVEAMLAQHPFRERLWGQLMVALYRSGRQGDASQAFHRARRTLADEVGIDPSPWLSRLHERILVQDPALEADSSSGARLSDMLSAPRHNLPGPRDRFIGRRRETAELQGLVRARRLVTLTGPPGCGKTRLALEVGRQMIDDFPHGVWLVPLDEIDDPELVPSAITTSMDVPTSDQAPLGTLAEHLGPRRLLLVLDNFEHVLPATTHVARLLDAAPQITVLVTSRTPLKLSGEQQYPLGPLTLPEDDQADVDPDRSEAVTLFADRAASVDPGFELDADTEPLVAELVRRLDGLPLAIELAAARLRTFPLRELHRRLDPALPELTAGPRDASARHRTLRDAIAWSDRLLGESPRALLRRLGIFAGTFTLDATEQVTGGRPVADVTDAVAALVDASLVRRPTDEDPERFSMLATVREYAADQLATAGETAKVARRHARYYAELAKQAEPELTGAQQADWLDRLERAHPNLRAAIDRSRDFNPDLALDMAGRLWRFWQFRGHLTEGRRLLEELLHDNNQTQLPRLRAFIGLAGICYWQFDLDGAESAYRRARDLAAELGEWRLELEALTGLIQTIACHRGDLQEAEPLERQLQDLVAEHPEPVAVGQSMATSMLTRLFAGDLEGCRSYGEPLLAACRDLGERWYEVQTLRTLALTSLMQDRPHQARDELRECLQLSHEIGDLAGMAIDLDRLAQAALRSGEAQRAVTLAGAASRLRDTAGGGLTVQAFRWETEPPERAARRSLTELQIETARARGRTMTPEDALDYATS